MLLRLAGARWEVVADGFDPTVPLTGDHGRIVGRSPAGWLRVFEGGKVVPTAGPRLAPHGGLVCLPSGIIAVTGAHAGGGPGPRRRQGGGADEDARAARLVRYERGAGGWREMARSEFAILPDARPLLVDLDGTARAGHANGHIAVLAGANELRYRHGVLGDGFEATRLIYAERQSLAPLASIELPEPWVFEDIAPRRYVDPETGRTALVTVRSGPQGAALVLVERAEPGSAKLAIVAEGAPIGMRNRWMAPIVAGERLLAIHTPHIGGILTAYRRAGNRLVAQTLRDGVSNHALGSRDLDVSVSMGSLLIVPSQDHKALIAIDLEQDARELWRLPLEAPVTRLLAADEQILVLDGQGRSFTVALR